MEMLKILIGKINFSELFPTKWSSLIFVAYMALFVNQGLLVTASQSSAGESHGYNYNTVAAVLATEIVKLVISIGLYAHNHNVLNLIKDSKKHLHVMLRYLVPAALYCLYNNLAFVNLAAFDPTSYYLLLQLRVVLTGLLFQVVFKKQLSVKQWLSLVLLTAGCMIKQIPMREGAGEGEGGGAELPPPPAAPPLTLPASPLVSFNMLLILVQVGCSCLAGVYNELLLKSVETESCDVNVQNAFMYIDSVVCNLAVLAARGQLAVLADAHTVARLADAKVFAVIMNNAAIGIVTSLFLRSLNSVLKTFASALELVFTALLAWLLFGIPVRENTICAIAVVSAAVFMYSRNPVTNAKPKHAIIKEASLV